MDYKEMMVNLANDSGRRSLYPFTIGVISSIVSDPAASNKQKVSDVSLALKAMNETREDDSLPYDYADTEKAPTAMGATEENREEFIPLNYTTESEVVANA